MAEKSRGSGREGALPRKEIRPERRAAASGTRGRTRKAPDAKPARRQREEPEPERPTAKRRGAARTKSPDRSKGAGNGSPAPGAAARPASPRRAREGQPRPERSSTEAPGSGRSGKYVYCIIQSTKTMSFGSIGIGAEPREVYTIGYKDIAAVVSDTPLEVHDPTRENVLSHEGVNERVMHEYTVIPMSFGTVFKTADDIVELLRSAYAAFRDVLQKMENKLEFGLKVLWDPDEILQVVEKEDEGLRRLREEILKQRGSTYFARMQYGRMVDSLLQERSVFYVHEIFEGLRAVSVASRDNKPIGERMIMNAAFLVTRDKEQEFDSAVKEIGGLYPHLTFKYTGPWPPYNFVNIRLKLERAEDAG